MSKYGPLARALSGRVVGALELFFLDERPAQIAAMKYGAEIEKLDDGWLVKQKPIRLDDDDSDDPIVQAIRKAIQEAERSN